MKRLLVLILAGSFCAIADTPKPQLIDWSGAGTEYVIIGELGLPVGEEITIQGERITLLPDVYCTAFVVDAVNGTKLGTPKTIAIDNITGFPVGTRVTLKGHEYGTLKQLTSKRTNVSPQEARNVKPRQKLFLRFYPIQVIQPGGLKLDKAESIQ